MAMITSPRHSVLANNVFFFHQSLAYNECGAKWTHVKISGTTRNDIRTFFFFYTREHNNKFKTSSKHLQFRRSSNIFTHLFYARCSLCFILKRFLTVGSSTVCGHMQKHCQHCVTTLSTRLFFCTLSFFSCFFSCLPGMLMIASSVSKCERRASTLFFSFLVGVRDDMDSMRMLMITFSFSPCPLQPIDLLRHNGVFLLRYWGLRRCFTLMQR
ncbi:transmembrane protein, putative [Bodo saltans]|uniref:Transmembrane protein, putative n=1 Tax=Bodo saltans TaxID=75058 RepID=A0A0S4JH79_BODSA|nr:transmembrane protein, putative [Bodo saltans]|eukprot:CUG89293.1 transmembrane protein, putative [Bodo saltans]